MKVYYHDKPYLELLKDIMENGVKKEDRTGTGTISVFDRSMKFDLSSNTIPLLTTKKIHWKSIIHELLWYISGSTNNNDLEKNGVRIWREWAKEDGDLGPIYGKQLRNWEANGKSYDQLQYIINLLKTDPDSRRMVISFWNVGDLEHMSLYPCHYTSQIYTNLLPSGKRAISLKLIIRSNDMFLGCPFNIAQYSILLHMLAHITNMEVGTLNYSGGDCHIYLNHLEQVNEQLSRNPFPSPILELNSDIKDINKFTFDDFYLIDYKSHPPIKGKVSI